METRQFWMENAATLLGTGFFGTVITAYLTHVWTKRRMHADTDKVITETIRDLVSMARDEAEQQRNHRVKCEADLAVLQEKVFNLEKLINQQGNA